MMSIFQNIMSDDFVLINFKRIHTKKIKIEARVLPGALE